VDPHAANVSPRVTMAEQHSGRCAALERAGIGGA